MTPNIAGIIPTVGRPDMLRLCLQSLVRQTLRPVEVIVVHCGQDRETREVVEDPAWRAAGITCRYFHHGTRNAAAQRNFAIQQTACEWLLLLDDDVELEDGWVAELFAPLLQDGRVGATMGRLVNQPFLMATGWWRLYRLLVGGSAALAPGRLTGAAIPNGFPDGVTDVMPTEWIGGGIAAIRRAAFESVGGFAPYFAGSSPGEDLDLGYRLSRRWRVLFVPTARAVHHAAAAGRSPSAEYQLQSMRSRYAILVRGFGRTRAGAVVHLLIWMMFQGASEVGALRKGTARHLPSVWAGRLRGVASCLRWTPPVARYDVASDSGPAS